MAVRIGVLGWVGPAVLSIIGLGQLSRSIILCATIEEPRRGGAVESLSFSKAGTDLVYVTGKVHLGKLRMMGGEIKSVQSTSIAGFSKCCASFRPNANVFAFDTEANAVQIKRVDGKLVTTLRGHAAPVYCLAFSPDGKLVATGSRDYTVRVWDAATGGSIAVLRGHKGSVFCVKFSRDGRTIASGSADNTVILWDVKTSASRGVLQGHDDRVVSLDFCPTDGTLASGSWDGTIRFWDISKQKALATLFGHSGGIISLIFSPNGDFLASGGWHPEPAFEDLGGEIRVWDVKTKENALTLMNKSEIRSLAFSPNGRQLVFGGADGTITVFTLMTRKITRLLDY